MKSSRSISNFLWSPWESAEATPGGAGIITNDEVVSWRELVNMVERCERGLDAVGINSADLVLAVGPPGPRTFATILACLRTGAGVLPLTERQWATRGKEFADKISVTCGSGGVIRHRATQAAHARPHCGYLAYLTSGSTGKPKLVKQSPRRGTYRGVAVDKRYGVGPDLGAHVMGNPTFHLGTLGPALYSLQAGNCVVIPVNWSTTAFFDAAARHQATSGFVSAGNLFELVEYHRDPPPSLKVLQHGGSHVPAWLKRAVIEKFGTGIIEFYGTSNGPVADISGAEWLEHPGSVGRPYRGVKVEVADSSGVGPLRLVHRRGDSPAGSAESPGDIGFLEDGYLYIVGRESDSDRIPHLRKRIAELEGVIEVALVQGVERIVGAVEIAKESAAEAVDRLLAHESGEFSVRYFSPYTLPRTPSAKLALRDTWTTILADLDRSGIDEEEAAK